MLLSEIRTQVLRLVGDEDGVVFSSAILNSYINEAMQTIAEDTQCLRAITTITTTDASGLVSLPSNYMALVSVRYDGAVIPNLGPNYTRGYFSTQATGTPSGYSVYSGTKLLLYPLKVNGTGLNIILEYVPYPATLAADGDTSELPAPLHYAAVQYALARCYQQLNDQESYSMAMQDFTNRVIMWKSRFDNESIDRFASIREVEDWIP